MLQEKLPIDQACVLIELDSDVLQYEELILSVSFQTSDEIDISKNSMQFFQFNNMQNQPKNIIINFKSTSDSDFP